ncbi:hypothetical protein [Nocardia sp. BMG51109]|uniref:hypothetical protein n=1 Tax=Nocardia sp. BMG51109 TaxID=1056816 RepID=UPI0004632E28|nr:hypothetical protein [Nocardia sp. BMG51109]
MISFCATLAVVVLFAVVVYHYAPKRGERAAELFERYRPHAPMADWSLSYYDDQRQYSELTAIRARRESEPDEGGEAGRAVRGTDREEVQF